MPARPPALLPSCLPAGFAQATHSPALNQGALRRPADTARLASSASSCSHGPMSSSTFSLRPCHLRSLPSLAFHDGKPKLKPQALLGGKVGRSVRPIRERENSRIFALIRQPRAQSPLLFFVGA
ncbi:hypothetical protein MPTK1_4g05550 [Marchantia polymorpha subsp. ruderalis]|uniref:Uncharacterized protein n=2 Tax=Marchantia polymorpha TaxID=3197 RepID=A0AAF6B6P2_MARPO|nr:hypothetical protein MARPO_0087s0036 [Marchantia polymorpha]BBN07676.1 hypothetical protein Mp_4g05550 [Marchantia polymorpha subsp. ruderalis]|eukprot:PTQ33597.1 hypothetical protein MARPO_0087s0036 [Marchantia polymorpha]